MVAVKQNVKKEKKKIN